ncbi:MAG: peptide ABC transporter substrate-binding protein [Puniceicoccales bacterium]|jgi:oligopeptide transport system substrate-binding protein|nr:peptide ABC transporter substrate-binding protein [Puniceicoccales bacterium]
MKKAWLLFFVLSLLAGCKNEKAPVSQDLRIASPYELASADPQKTCRGSDHKILQAAFEGLIVPDPETMQPLPGVAERWTVSPDGKVYEFFLRDDAKWSDGTPVTAEDFVFSAKRALSSRLICASVDMFFNLKNAKAFFSRTIRDFSRVGIHAINSRMLRIELEQCTPYFFEILMHPCWFPLNQKVIDSFEEYDKGHYPHDVFRTKIISNGPFLFSERIPSKCILFRKNESYWDAENVLLQKVVFLFFINQTSSIKSFTEDEVHIVEIFDDKKIEGMCSKGESAFGISFECVGLMFNTENPVFKNKDVRTALSIAIDREKLLDTIEKHRILAAYRFIPPLNDKYSGSLFCQDVELAKKLLEKAGYGPENKFPEISILFNVMEHPIFLVCMEQICEDLKTSLGITCRIDPQNMEVFLDRKKKAKFDMIKFSYGGIYCDPILAMNPFTSHSARNYGRWHDKNYDKIVASIPQADDILVRNRLIHDAESYLVEEMPIIPLFFNSNSYLIKKNVSGWFPNAANSHPVKFVYFEK